MAQYDITTTAQQVVDTNTPEAQPANKENSKSKATKKKNAEFRSRAEVCKRYRQQLIGNWSTSIDYRRGKPTASQSDDEQVTVPLDWSMTKTKQASLFSQVPQVRVSHPFATSQAGPWLPVYESKLNDTLVTAGIEAAMDEVLPDCINAAGIGLTLVSYETITVDKEVPAVDLSILPPELQQKVLQTGEINGVEVPMETVPEAVDRRYKIRRLSPSDFLWPLDFTGSNFDEAAWIGRSDRITWAEAVQRFGLTEADKSKVLGDDRTHLERLTYDIEKDKVQPEEKVTFDEIFYKEYQYDSEAKSYSTIHHLVFINGKEDPVIDEPWKGQKVNEDGTISGALKYPIRVLTLSYISDDAIPPSDSAIGRSQVDEINKARRQMILQRERNIPMRWANSNVIDPSIMQALMRGKWANIIPVQGDGSRFIGEVAKQTHPQEDFSFYNIAKQDLTEAWSTGPNQLGSGADVETKGESQEISQSFQTRITRERAKVASYVVGIAEVLGGIMCLFEDPQSFGEGFDPAFSKNLGFSILADSTLLLDANQRLERLDRFLNVYAKTGFVNLEPVLREIATLTGLDPNTVIKAPEPQAPPPPNVSLRLSGQEDMMNPLMLAIYLAQGKPPTPELIQESMKLIQMAVSVPGTVQPGMPPTPPQGGPEAEMPPTPIGEANPEAGVLPKITKRSDDPSAGGKEL
jgi:hypothetical protein